MILLYIDPGTGSAIFSIIIGIAAAAFFAFHAFYLKIKNVFKGGRIKVSKDRVNEKSNKIVIYAEDKRYWIVFKPIVEELEKRKVNILYLTTSKDDPVFEPKFEYIKPELLASGNTGFARLNFISADFFLATTPGLEVYQWKRSKNVKHYSHILHAPIYGPYEIFALDYYDSVLLSSEPGIESNFIRQLEKVRNLPKKEIISVGCPYLDVYKEKINQIQNTKNSTFTVLLSPSWGNTALLSKFGEKLLDPLVKTGWQIIVRPHPQSLISEKALVDSLQEKYKSSVNLVWDFERENIYSLKKSDAMISDFSGIIYDYTFLYDKAVFYFPKEMDLRPYDEFEIYSNQQEMFLFQILEKIGIPITVDSVEKILELINKFNSDPLVKNSIKEAKTQIWTHQGKAGINVVDYMLQKVNSSYA